MWCIFCVDRFRTLTVRKSNFSKSDVRNTLAAMTAQMHCLHTHHRAYIVKKSIHTKQYQAPHNSTTKLNFLQILRNTP